MKILFSGSREFTDIRFVSDKVHELIKEFGPFIAIHGGARGLDSIVDFICKYNGLETIPYVANWARWGNAAGGIRNKEMYDIEQPDLVAAFPLQRSKGTWNMVNIARQGNTPIIIYMYDGREIREGFINENIN